MVSGHAFQRSLRWSLLLQRSFIRPSATLLAVTCPPFGTHPAVTCTVCLPLYQIDRQNRLPSPNQAQASPGARPGARQNRSASLCLLLFSPCTYSTCRPAVLCLQTTFYQAICWHLWYVLLHRFDMAILYSLPFFPFLVCLRLPHSACAFLPLSAAAPGPATVSTARLCLPCPLLPLPSSRHSLLRIYNLAHR